eukprot:Nk52_evm7s1569 gene=Nk52_evmTU7s1569
MGVKQMLRRISWGMGGKTHEGSVKEEEEYNSIQRRAYYIDNGDTLSGVRSYDGDFVNLKHYGDAGQNRLRIHKKAVSYESGITTATGAVSSKEEKEGVSILRGQIGGLAYLTNGLGTILVPAVPGCILAQGGERAEGSMACANELTIFPELPQKPCKALQGGCGCGDLWCVERRNRWRFGRANQRELSKEVYRASKYFSNRPKSAHCPTVDDVDFSSPIGLRSKAHRKCSSSEAEQQFGNSNNSADASLDELRLGEGMEREVRGDTDLSSSKLSLFDIALNESSLELDSANHGSLTNASFNTSANTSRGGCKTGTEPHLLEAELGTGSFLTTRTSEGVVNAVLFANGVFEESSSDEYEGEPTAVKGEEVDPYDKGQNRHEVVWERGVDRLKQLHLKTINMEKCDDVDILLFGGCNGIDCFDRMMEDEDSL